MCPNFTPETILHFFVFRRNVSKLKIKKIREMCPLPHKVILFLLSKKSRNKACFKPSWRTNIDRRSWRCCRRIPPESLFAPSLLNRLSKHFRASTTSSFHWHCQLCCAAVLLKFFHLFLLDNSLCIMCSEDYVNFTEELE